jgi:hypothetical protein
VDFTRAHVEVDVVAGDHTGEPFHDPSHLEHWRLGQWTTPYSGRPGANSTPGLRSFF